METVNLEKICELLEKGVDNPSIQDEKGKFSLEKWRKEIQPYTETFLGVITKPLNEVMKEEKDFRTDIRFKIVKKSQGRKTKILSLQEATCKLPEPFAITIGDSGRRFIDAVIVLSPSPSSIEENYKDCILWGLRWWGTTESAATARDRFLSINENVGFTVSLAKDKALGGSYAWLFNSVKANKLMKIGFDQIADIIIKDFEKLSSSLGDKREIFVDGIIDPGPLPATPTRGDVERAVLRIWSENRQRKIDKTLVMKTIEADMNGKGIALKSDWWTSIEGKLEDWFG